MTTKELYTEAYKRERLARNVAQEPIGSSTEREALIPIPIPHYIRSAAIASYKNKDVIEVIDPLQLSDRYEAL